MTDVEMQSLKHKNLILESQMMNFESRLNQSETAKFELTKTNDSIFQGAKRFEKLKH